VLTKALIAAAVVTCRNSSLRQMKALLGLDVKLLQELLESQEHKHQILSVREWAQLNELVDLHSCRPPCCQKVMKWSLSPMPAVCAGSHQPSSEFIM